MSEPEAQRTVSIWDLTPEQMPPGTEFEVYRDGQPTGQKVVAGDVIASKVEEYERLYEQRARVASQKPYLDKRP